MSYQSLLDSPFALIPIFFLIGLVFRWLAKATKDIKAKRGFYRNSFMAFGFGLLFLFLFLPIALMFLSGGFRD